MADQNTPTVSKDSKKELGQSGTLIYNGIISGEEYNRSLKGKAALRQYDIMRRSDSTVHSALQVVKLPLLATTWTIEPAADIDGNVEDSDKEIAAFIERELMHRNVNWHAFMREGLNMLDYGHSVFEKVYELCEFEGQPRIGLAKLAARRQTTIYSWQIGDGLPGITQILQAGGRVEIPREKLVIFTNDKEGDNHEGISLLRYAFKDWDIKDKLTLVNAVALEKMGVGIPVVKAKDGETPSDTDFTEAEDVLGNMRANEKSFIKLPSTIDIEMLDLKANSTKEVIPTLQFHNRNIYASILATFMDLGGSSGSGAKSLSGDLTSLFMKSEEAVANTMQASITQDIIMQLCDFNYSDLPNGYPKLTFGTIADDDTTAFATSINNLASAGMLTYDAELEDHIRNLYRMPALPEDLKNVDKVATPTKTKPDTAVTPDDQANLKDKQTQAALRQARAARTRLIDVVNG